VLVVVIPVNGIELIGNLPVAEIKIRPIDGIVPTPGDDVVSTPGA
jgi:hypothetical protein